MLGWLAADSRGEVAFDPPVFMGLVNDSHYGTNSLGVSREATMFGSADVEQYASDGERFHYVSGNIDSTDPQQDGLLSVYGWLCIEEVGVPPDPYASEAGPVPWRGSFFLHMEPDAPVATDLFASLEWVDCLDGEDASSASDCDGIDNDRDGIVDEGAGVPCE